MLIVTCDGRVARNSKSGWSVGMGMTAFPDCDPVGPGWAAADFATAWGGRLWLGVPRGRRAPTDAQPSAPAQGVPPARQAGLIRTLARPANGSWATR